MGGKRAHIILPDELADEIDRLVGPRGRSRFIVSAASAEVRRQSQLKALELAAGSWKDAHHPELKAGGRKWVARMRRENEGRRSGVGERG